MKAYLDLLKKIMDQGTTVQTGACLPSEGNRKPTARRLHGEQIQFDLQAGFPAVTTKPLWWRAVCAEWIWFMRGSGDGQYLIDQKVDSIWKAWFKPGTTDLGPCYPVQMRRMQGVRWQDRPAAQPDLTIDDLQGGGGYFGPATGHRELGVYHNRGYLYGVTRADSGGQLLVHKLGPHHEVVETDQVGEAVRDIRNVVANPFDRARRRIIISLWNPAQIASMSLPPCHTFYMFDMVPPGVYDAEPCDTFEDFERWRKDTLDGRWTLNLQLVMRSCDVVKGLPFNISSAALFCHVMAAVTGTKPGTLTVTFNDCHVYDNQTADVEEQLARTPFQSPVLEFDPAFLEVCPDLSIEQAHRLTPSMFKLIGYQHHPRLRSESEVAV